MYSMRGSWQAITLLGTRTSRPRKTSKIALFCRFFYRQSVQKVSTLRARWGSCSPKCTRSYGSVPSTIQYKTHASSQKSNPFLALANQTDSQRFYTFIHCKTKRRLFDNGKIGRQTQSQGAIRNSLLMI